jgi:hypothetical protein
MESAINCTPATMAKKEAWGSYIPPERSQPLQTPPVSLLTRLRLVMF